MLLVVAMLALSIWTWRQLPFDAQVPVHFDIKGSADEYMGKEGLLVIPLITFLITIWTLSSDLAWHKTHRLGGWLMILHGLAFLIAGLLSNTTLIVYLVISLLIVSLIILPVYSYCIWRSDSDRSTT